MHGSFDMRIMAALLLALGFVAARGVPGTELVDAEIVSGASPVLENAGGTVRLEDARLGRLGVAVLPVPEPAATWQLAAGGGLLSLLVRRRRRARRAALGMLASTLLALPALGQVPQATPFTGRLVDALGSPLAGPVDLELRVFDADSGGTLLYSEQHLGTPLDVTGGFSVQLGLGTSPSGSYDASLFSSVDRWLEIVVDSEVLTPRQKVGTVPWALVAERANELVPDPNAPRFEDCGDGSVADHQTGLLWEKKTGTLSAGVVCQTSGCPDPHDVNNEYGWSVTGVDPDGDAFTDFLAKLNDSTFGEATTSHDPTGCLHAHCDWRLPGIAELETILDCANTPCIDPVFGVTGSYIYWSASNFAGTAYRAWAADFGNGTMGDLGKIGAVYTRAVRVGACD